LTSVNEILVNSIGTLLKYCPFKYPAGDASAFAPAQLIISAADGLKIAAGVNGDLIQKEFLK